LIAVEDDLDILLLQGLRSLPFGSTMDAVRNHFGSPAEEHTYEEAIGPALHWKYPEIEAVFHPIDDAYRLVQFQIEYGSNYRLFKEPFGEPYDITFIPMLRSHGVEVLRATEPFRKMVNYFCSHGIDFFTSVGDVMNFGWSIFDYRHGLFELDQAAFGRLRANIHAPD
jgi:hypothetical protein